MKKLCCIIFVLILFSGCETKEPITVSNADYSAIVNISFNNDNYQYLLTKMGSAFSYKSCGESIPIDFLINKNEVITTYSDKELKYPYLLNKSHVSIITRALLKSSGIEIYPDYNGNYILYETIDTGEYALNLDSSGFPKEIKLNNLVVKFSDVKEVSSGSEKK